MTLTATLPQKKQSPKDVETMVLLMNRLKNPKCVHVENAPQTGTYFVSGNNIVYLLKGDKMPRYGFKITLK